MSTNSSQHRCQTLPASLCFLFAAWLSLNSCNPAPANQYGFITMLGQDTISVESVTRQGNRLESDEVDRFPRVQLRHTVVNLNEDGGIKHLVMEIHTPSEASGKRDRTVVADVTNNTVHLTKTDSTGTVKRDFATGGSKVVAHVPQMYSLYELYFTAALKPSTANQSATNQSAANQSAANPSVATNESAANPSTATKPATPIQLRQFYIDREFDRFPLGSASVTPVGNGKAEVTHDWLSGVGEATLDSANNLLSYSGSRTTYRVNVQRLSTTPDIKATAARWEAKEAASGGVRSLSVHDSVHAQIGNTTFTIDYSRPLQRGRTLLGDVIPYDRVWRTGANAATQFTTSTPIKIAGLQVPAGTYSLFSAPHTTGVDLIINKVTGEWGTEYNAAQNLGSVRMTTETPPTPVEEFTISINSIDQKHGRLILEWGNFRWIAPVEVH